MLVYNNKEYRNLQEQVEKNKADIEDWNSKEDTLANFGIKIIGKVQSVDQLPDVADYDYGDAYMVGSDETADYNYYLATRPTAEVAEKHWQNIGKLSITGPEGPKGDEITSITNAGWSYGTATNDPSAMVSNNNIKVTMNDGRNIYFEVRAYAKQGATGNQGIQGIQGEKGEKGDKGDTGEQGPQGEMGPTAPAYHIVGTVTSTSQLPDPTLLKDLSAAYILETSETKQLYIQVGLSIDVAKWEYLGDLDVNNFWELSNKILAPVEAVDTVQIKKLAVLNAGGLSCSSPSISGVASCSAINSPSSSLTLSGKNGVELIHDGTTVLTTNQYNSITLPNIREASTNEDRSLLSIWNTDGGVTKLKAITGNGVTGELKATKVTTTGDITSSGTISGTFKGNLTGNVTGNATTANKAAAATKVTYRSMRTDSSNFDDNTKNGWNDSTGCLTYIPCVKATVPFNNGTADAKEDAQIQNLCWDNNLWGMQIATTNNGDGCPHRQSMAFRNLSNGVWGSWHQMLNDIGHYNITGNWTHSGTNTFTGINTFTGTVKANSIMDNINNQVIKGSSFRLGAGTYKLDAILKMVFTTVPSNYMVTIKCPSGTMKVTDSEIGIYNNVHNWDYDSAGHQAADYYDSAYTHDEDSASAPSEITITCTDAIQVIISC